MRYVFAECTYCLLCAAASAKVAAADVGGERVQIERVITQVCSDLFYLTESGPLRLSREQRLLADYAETEQ